MNIWLFIYLYLYNYNNNTIMENFEIIKRCLSCDKDVYLLMDLGDQPLANNFHDKMMNMMFIR